MAAIAGLTMLWSAAPASATTRVVDDDGDQCPLAGFNNIQAAVNASAATDDDIRVCGGTYTEQVTVTSKSLTIDGDGASAVSVKAPNILTPGPCDSASPNRPIICANSSSNLTVQDLTLDGDGKGNANNRMFGVFFRNSAGAVTNTTITDVRNTPLDGIQGGVGIGAFNDDATARTVNITNNTIRNFQKNGTAMNGANLTANHTGNTITGVGPQSVIAQNGAQVSLGATGTVSNNTISDMDFTPDSACSSGVLLFQNAAGVQVNNNTIDEVQCSINEFQGAGTTPFTGNTITDGRYAVTLDDSAATLTNNRLDGSSAPESSGLFVSEAGLNASYTVTANGNSFTGFNDEAITLDDGDADAFTATLNASFNRIAGNGDGAHNGGPGALNAENNWWGCNAGPANAACDATVNDGGGTLDANPWLVLGASANPATITAGGSSQITASVAGNSNGQTPGGNTFPSGINVAFATTLGSILSPVPTSSPNAVSTLTSAGAGTATVTATLDGQPASTAVTVNAVPTPAAGGTLGQVQPGTAKKKCKKGRKLKKGKCVKKKRK